MRKSNFTSAWPFTWKGAPSGQRCGPRSGGAGARAVPPDPGPRGHPQPPKPSRPRSLPQPGALSTARVAGFGTQTTRAENRHPPRSMAATLAAARAAPPPRRPECGAGATAQWVARRGRDNGPRLSPRPPSPLRLGAAGLSPPAAPRARAVLTSRFAAPKQPGPQRPLPARGLQPANRQVPTLPFCLACPAPPPNAGPDSSLC